MDLQELHQEEEIPVSSPQGSSLQEESVGAGELGHRALCPGILHPCSKSLFSVSVASVFVVITAGRC